MFRMWGATVYKTPIYAQHYHYIILPYLYDYSDESYAIELRIGIKNSNNRGLSVRWSTGWL